MVSKQDDSELELLKDFLKTRGFKSTLECFEKEESYKSMEKKEYQTEKPTKFTKSIQDKKDKMKQYTQLQDSYKILDKKHKSIVQCSRQIFEIVLNCLEQLNNLKDGNQSTEHLGDTIEKYKAQIGKYHKIIMSDEWSEQTDIMSQSEIQENKRKLKQAKQEKNTENLIEILLAYRVNALQIVPELRKNLVYELINNDIFFIEETKSNQFVLDLLNIHAYNLRHATLSVLSIISATFKGVEYLIKYGFGLLEKIIEIMKGIEDGQVLQRFSIAILQKMSVKEGCVTVYMKTGLIDWIIKLLQRSRINEIHIFCLDFASALLANILHSNITLEFLENNVSVCKNLIETFLSMIKEPIPTSVLMHILICLSYLSKERFNAVKDGCKFYDRITEFVEYYSNIKANNESAEIDKRTVLDLCAHMFHTRDNTMDMSEAMEINELKYEDRIKEFENEQGDLIFECFQDEIS
jgi:hypothetical protein